MNVQSKAANDAAKKYLLLGGRVVDGTGAAPIEDGAVLVEEGKISFVGPRAAAPKTSDAVVIDAAGLTILPGLIDGHNGLLHWGTLGGVEILRHYLQHGVTTAIVYTGNPGGKPLGVPLRDAIDNGMVRGCARLVVGYVVNCTHGHNNGRRADGPWEIRAAVRELVEGGADFIKTASTGGFWGRGEGLRTPNYTQEELNALVDEAHAWGLLVGVHAHADPGLTRAIEAGADMIYHGCLIDRAALEKMKARGTWFLPTLRVTSQRNIGAWADRPWQTPKMQAAAGPHRAGVRLAHEMGVRLALGSDGPGAMTVWKAGEGTNFELCEMGDCGLTPLQAISAGTLGTARAYKIDARVGSLEVGKEADILCVEGNPLADLRRFEKQELVSLVLQKGRVEYASGKFSQYYSIRDPAARIRP